MYLTSLELMNLGTYRPTSGYSNPNSSEVMDAVCIRTQVKLGGL